MRAITVAKFGGPEVLQVSDVERPVPGPGEVLVRVLAAGVGPWDAHLRSGGWTGQLPYIPGGEFAGVVEGDSGAGRGLRQRHAGLRLPRPDRVLRAVRGVPGRADGTAPGRPAHHRCGRGPRQRADRTPGPHRRARDRPRRPGPGHGRGGRAGALRRADRPGARGQRGGHGQPAAPRVRAPPRGGRGHRPHPAHLARPGPGRDRTAGPATSWPARLPPWRARPGRPGTAPRSPPRCTPTTRTRNGSAGGRTTASRGAAS